MTARRVALAAAAASVALMVDVAPVGAQDGDACRDVAVELGVESADVARFPCQLLANHLRIQSAAVRAASDRILAPGGRNPAAVFSERSFQQHNPTHASLSGSLAQGDAVSSVMPVGLASGSLALVGSDAGNDALVSLGLNPVVLFFLDGASSALARYARFMDLSVLIPATQEDTASTGGESGIRYVGARLRLNWSGLSAGSRLWAAADSLVGDLLAQTGRDVQKILELLRDAPDLEACARALDADEEASTLTSACGRPLTLGVSAAEAEQLGRELDRIRRSLDGRYFGADIRVDWGDPTLGGVEDAAGTFIFAGLGYGRKVAASETGATTLGTRLRLGARHATLKSDGSTSLAVEGALGFEVSRDLDGQEVALAAALEFRQGGADPDRESAFQTDFGVLRTSLVIPITAANGLSLAVGVPLTDNVSSYLSVNFNWALLLPGSSPVR